MWWLNVAWAQQAAQQGSKPGMLETVIIPFGAVFLIFYFLIIRPQGKKQKDQQNFLGSLKRGDAVVTSSGFFGTIAGITDRFITLEVAEGVSMKILKSHITGPVKEAQK